MKRKKSTSTFFKPLNHREILCSSFEGTATLVKLSFPTFCFCFHFIFVHIFIPWLALHNAHESNGSHVSIFAGKTFKLLIRQRQCDAIIISMVETLTLCVEDIKQCIRLKKRYPSLTRRKVFYVASMHLFEIFNKQKILKAHMEKFSRITTQLPLFQLKLKKFPTLHRRYHFVFIHNFLK